MARYTGAVCRHCRREGMKLFLKGERCYTDKCAVEKRPDQPPGEHGHARGRIKVTDFGIRLREKQKVKRMYSLTEGQFRRFFEKAARTKGVTGEVLIARLESRLDNVIYRLGFASSRKEARQMVRFGHIRVNGKRVNIPSYIVSAGDSIELESKSKKMDRVNMSLELLERRGFPDWLELDKEYYKGTVTRLPTRADVTIPIEEQLIVEFYSKV
ncbi:MAG: 30S ribosomal protein S4 [Thermodesulfobacteriota bacterium]